MDQIGIKLLQDSRLKNGLIVLYILIILGISASARATVEKSPVKSIDLVFKVRPVLTP